MQQNTRLIALADALKGEASLTAAELAARFGVAERTIYRDMERLSQAGVPVTGTPGKGYSIEQHVMLPPLALSLKELEALNLGLAVAQELADPALAAAIETLTAKIDAAQPTHPAANNAPSPFDAPARGLAHLRPLRAAIEARQMVRLAVIEQDGNITSHRLRPLALDHHVRSWVLTGFSETTQSFLQVAVEAVQSVTALQELFVDEPSKRLQDHTA